MAQDSQARRSVLVAIALGIATHPIQSVLLEKIDITIPVARMVVTLGLEPYVYMIVRASNLVFWSALFGVVLGIPLGLAVQRPVLRYWLVYLAAVWLLAIPLTLLSVLGFELLSWLLLNPDYWLYLLGVLCFAYFGAWLRLRTQRTALVAP